MPDLAVATNFSRNRAQARSACLHKKSQRAASEYIFFFFNILTLDGYGWHFEVNNFQVGQEEIFINNVNLTGQISSSPPYLKANLAF